MDRFPKMSVWQRASHIIYQVLFIIVSVKRDLVLFDGVELML